VTVSGDGVQLESAGSIAILRLRGQDNQVTGQAIASLDVAGDRNTVGAGAVTVANLAGQENKVTASAIDAVLINGDSNTVDGGTRIGFLTVNGNSNQIEAGTVEDRSMVGRDNEVTLK